MTLPTRATIIEVGPRDGLQNEAPVPLGVRINMVDQLSLTGLQHIESGAFVSEHKVPQLAHSQQVFSAIERQPGVCYSALVPNLQGLESALMCNVDQIAVFTAVSDTFCQRNIGCSLDESLRRFEPVLATAHKHHIPVRGYISCVIDCPFEGPSNPERVAALSEKLIKMGCYQVSLGETLGRGTANQVINLLDKVLKRVPAEKIAMHFHDTWGQALTNIYQSLTMGITNFDSSIAGLGGCPYAPGAGGNVATEDLVYLLHGLEVETGIDLNQLVQVGRDINHLLGRQPESKVSRAWQS